MGGEKSSLPLIEQKSCGKTKYVINLYLYKIIHEDIMKQKEIIGSKEAAKILHVSYVTLLAKIKDGTYDLPYALFGTIHKFKRKDVEDFFNNSFSKKKPRIKK